MLGSGSQNDTKPDISFSFQDCPPCDKSQFECSADRKCIAQQYICDLTPHCSDAEDELYCPEPDPMIKARSQVRNPTP